MYCPITRSPTAMATVGAEHPHEVPAYAANLRVKSNRLKALDQHPVLTKPLLLQGESIW